LLVLKHLPRLEKLDDVPVTYQEVEQARDIDLQKLLDDGEMGLTEK
jgi:hypothetical protein